MKASYFGMLVSRISAGGKQTTSDKQVLKASEEQERRRSATGKIKCRLFINVFWGWHLFSYQTTSLHREGYREDPVVGYNSGFNPHMKHSVEPLQVFVQLRHFVVDAALLDHYQALQCNVANPHQSFQAH